MIPQLGRVRGSSGFIRKVGRVATHVDREESSVMSNETRTALDVKRADTSASGKTLDEADHDSQTTNHDPTQHDHPR